MEKNSVDSDIEEQTPEIVESVPDVKPKRKLNLTPEQRLARSENMRKVALARIEKNKKVNEVIAEDVKKVKTEAIKKVKKIKQQKAFEINHPDSDSDESSDDEVFTSSKKRKNKNKTPTIIVKNYYTNPNKKEYDASENVAKLQQIYKPEPEPIPHPPQRVTLGYFV